MRLICTIDREEAVAVSPSADECAVLLYRPRPPGVGSIGNPIRLDLRRLPGTPSQEAIDLLSVALAITAGDRLVSRSDVRDRWTRDIDLEVPVADPQRWAALAPIVVEMATFLTGDHWSITFKEGGMTRAHLLAGRRVRSGRPRPSGDCICLFSGGMDSFIGAADLVHQGRHPVLVSQYQPGEQHLQRTLRTAVGIAPHNHFATTPNPLSGRGILDTQQRGRSFLFVALAAVVGSAMRSTISGQGPMDLFIPENGFIALNAPLTLARVGSCSTRTVHPRTVLAMQHLLDGAGLPFRLNNPYALKSKGQMTADIIAIRPELRNLLNQTISCGAYRRNNYHQCGYCIPCLIRRAAFLRAGIMDETPYVEKKPSTRWRLTPKWEQGDSIAAVDTALRDEDALLRRLRLSFKGVPLPIWSALEDMHTRGLHEVRDVVATL